jgi:hypothetical protein
MGAICRDCADLHQEVPAATMVGKTPVCREHWRSRMGIPKVPSALRDLPLPKPAPVFVASAEEREIMEGKVCGCGCGEKMRKDSTREFKMGHEPAGGGRHFCHSEARTQAQG